MSSPIIIWGAFGVLFLSVIGLTLYFVLKPGSKGEGEEGSNGEAFSEQEEEGPDEEAFSQQEEEGPDEEAFSEQKEEGPDEEASEQEEGDSEQQQNNSGDVPDNTADQDPDGSHTVTEKLKSWLEKHPQAANAGECLDGGCPVPNRKKLRKC